MPPIYVVAWRRQLGNVDEDRVVFICIFLLYISVKANSLQERFVLKLNGALEVVVGFLLAEFPCYPFVFIMILPLLRASLLMVLFHRQVCFF